MSFLEELTAAAERLQLRRVGVLVGVSGGPDSVALLRGLQLLAGSFELDLRAAHLNHGLRASAADDDAEWVRQLCERIAVPVVIAKEAVQERAHFEGRSLEEAGRVVRYEFFERTAREFGSTHVLVAHTADDQVETVVHHLLRGTGIAGLRGMKSKRPLAEGITLARPLLKIGRRTIEVWLAEIGQDYRIDATNAETTRTRSRIRHRVLPFLEAEVGPGLRESIVRLAEQSDELQSVLDDQAERLLATSLVDDSAGTSRLDCGALALEPQHLVREAFIALWKRKSWPRQAMGFQEWDRLYRLVKDGGKVSLPGRIEATRRGSLIVIGRRS
jgi:tRNA(Ile)-lysidine synthase